MSLSDNVVIKSILSMPFAENSYIAHFQGNPECIIIDPGLEPQKILRYLDQNELTPTAIFCTHGHSDHIAGISAIRELWPECPIVIGVKEADMLTDPVKNLSAQFGVPLICPAADTLVQEGDSYSAAGFDLLVRDTPGHSIGHVVFIWEAGTPTQVFGGDVLFADSIGRTDFPGGSFNVLAKSIQEKLYTLPADTIILPGHGPATTTGREQETNPFVRKDSVTQSF